MNEKGEDISTKPLNDDNPYIDHKLREEYDKIMVEVDRYSDEKRTRHDTRNSIISHPIVQFFLLPYRFLQWLSTGLKF